jgi:hypothetical protein
MARYNDDCIQDRTQVGGGLSGCCTPPRNRQNQNLKNIDFLDIVISDV